MSDPRQKDLTMNIFDLVEIFDQQFKFQVGQTLRHKGDKKEYGANDVGVFVLALVMQQELHDNSLIFERSYHCRIIAFSGSGQIFNFKEHELQTIQEWQQSAVNQEVERNMLRSDCTQLEGDILNQFGLSKQDRFYLKNSDGEVDNTKEFRMNGFRSNKETGNYEISVRQCNTLNSGIESIHVSDKSIIEKITK